MGKGLVIVVVFAIASLVGFIFAANGRGWNDNIDWKTLDEGLALAKTTDKPLMVVIHKTWCGACKALKPLFAASNEIEQQSREFVMVNLQDDEEPSDTAYQPDGGYIPRIVYLNPDGKVRPDISNKKRPEKYKYYYSDDKEVLMGMKDAAVAFTSEHQEL